MLYTNATTLEKYGFLYTPFRASAYYYIIPSLTYILVKSMFVALGQGSGTTQAVALVVIEAAALISASVLRPWMDKPTNAINISICVINFLNAVLLLIFTGVFNGPGLLIGVSGVVFFILNAVFALILLLVVLVASTFSFLKKDPETRYQPVADNRASFIKSQTTLTTELDALGLAARGGPGAPDFYGEKLGADDSSHDIRSSVLIHQHRNSADRNAPYHDPYSQPGTPSMPMLPSSTHGSVSPVSRPHSGVFTVPRAGSPFSKADSDHVMPNDRTYPEFRSQNNSS